MKYPKIAEAKRPEIGDTIEVYGQRCTIYKIHPFGTVDVEAPDGRCWRVSGLNFF